ncbi:MULTISPECIES: GtrA family protein [Legionella]|uniref:O antigen biosynthesis protein n=1 Tax=Legionella maceachernii TaxID=466 RepID=A0A0W0VW05_9GAMM|nr:GtrA family protein [Legionella maceachernii]KTD24157.1 O antigen biosynthesis protein [Legionella maceachernii]SJZ87593.1 GtrA-like protein [Legionella maceachernii]SUO98924.1 GtrA-like protein [Legionella maceachernii]
MNSRKQIIRYIFVGILNTVFSYLLYAIFIFLGLQYAKALFLATVLGVLFNFQTIGRLVFNNSNRLLIFKFIGVYAFLYLINISVITLLKELSADFYLTGLVTIIFSAGLGFILNKYLVFKSV